MDNYVGVWIDHERALIVTISGGEVSLKSIKSEVEPHFRLSGGYRSSSSSATSSISEKKPEERRKHQLKRYHRELIENVRTAKAIIVFGPGEAKTELVREMREVHDLGEKIRAIEPSDKLTDKQVVAKVKKFFSPSKT